MDPVPLPTHYAKSGDVGIAYQAPPETVAPLFQRTHGVVWATQPDSALSRPCVTTQAAICAREW